ncbi:MAG: ester cyclase [Deltaproteobacteria bacterium]|nr:ester cyclase [Deltaproteobacteria bacterium]
MPSLTDVSRRLVRRLYDEYLNPGHLDRLGEIVAADFIGPAEPRGPAGFAASIGALRAAFPDLRYELTHVVAEDDRVAVRWICHGTHRGPFRGIGPTGVTIATVGSAIFQQQGGMLVRAWVETDRLGFLQALGALPAEIPPRP